jgi:hypothetical protein
VFRRPVDDEKFGDDRSRMNTPNSRFVMNFQLFVVAPHPPLPQMHIVSGILFCIIHTILGTPLETLYMSRHALVTRPSCVPARASELQCLDEVRRVLVKYRDQNLRLPDDLERVLTDDVSSQSECIREYMREFFASAIFIQEPVLRELIAINTASYSRGIKGNEFSSFWSRSELLNSTTDRCRMHTWYYCGMHELMDSPDPALHVAGQVVIPPVTVIDQLIAIEIDTLTKLQAGRRRKRGRTDESHERERRAFRTENTRDQVDATDRYLLQTIRRESFTDDMQFLQSMFNLLDSRPTGAVVTTTMMSYLSRVQQSWAGPVDLLMGDASDDDYYAQNFRAPLLAARASGMSHDDAVSTLYTSDGVTTSLFGDLLISQIKAEKHRLVGLSGIVPMTAPMSSSSSSIQIRPPAPALRIKFPFVHKPDVVVSRFLITLLERISKMRSVAEFIALDLPGMIAATSFPGVVYSMSAKIWAEDILRFFSISRKHFNIMIAHQSDPLTNMAFKRLLDNHSFAQASLNWYVAFGGQYQHQPLERITLAPAPNMPDRILPPIDVLQRIAYDFIIELLETRDEDSVPG